MKRALSLNLKKTITLVTGGAKGLGLAIAKYLADQGSTVCIADVDKSALKKIECEFDCFVMDVTDIASVKDTVELIVDKYGKIDVLVNNAGVIYNEPFVNITKLESIMHDYASFKKSLLVNLDSVFIVTREVAEKMVMKRTKGVIVNISSISSCGNEGQTAYSAAKAAVNAMTVTWSKELGKFGIRCNAVSPGFIDTDSTNEALSESIIKHIKTNTPLRSLGAPLDVASAVGCMVENEFVNGAIFDITGGLTL